jgi:hypothetical protein
VDRKYGSSLTGRSEVPAHGSLLHPFSTLVMPSDGCKLAGHESGQTQNRRTARWLFQLAQGYKQTKATMCHKTLRGAFELRSTHSGMARDRLREPR